jgi:hypothetical protein
VIWTVTIWQNTSFSWDSYGSMRLQLVMEGVSKWALQWYSKCHCVATVTKSLHFLKHAIHRGYPEPNFGWFRVCMLPKQWVLTRNAQTWRHLFLLSHSEQHNVCQVHYWNIWSSRCRKLPKTAIALLILRLIVGKIHDTEMQMELKKAIM